VGRGEKEERCPSFLYQTRIGFYVNLFSHSNQENLRSTFIVSLSPREFTVAQLATWSARLRALCKIGITPGFSFDLKQQNGASQVVKDQVSN